MGGRLWFDPSYSHCHHIPLSHINMGKKKSKGKVTTESSSAANEDLIWVDPARVRFQHARIRPYFSGCGRSVQQTLDDMRQGKVLPADIPPIQVCLICVFIFVLVRAQSCCNDLFVGSLTTLAAVHVYFDYNR